MISRRSAVKLLAGASVGTSLGAALPVFARDLGAPDYRIEIASTEIDLSAKRKLRTTAYNGKAPGDLIRLREGRPVSIEITNRTDRPEVVHWHGLFLPPAIDGAMEEGTPAIAPGATTRIEFTPEPAGFRWYHTHTMAGNDLKLAQYGGQHGFLYVEPKQDAGRYDREFFLGLHDWNGQLLGADDGAMDPVYEVTTINGKVMGAGEPLRVREGERVLLHILNTSASEVHWIALAGHQFQVIALDGNPVPTPAKVDMLRLAPAERVCAVVEMSNPGVWVLGEVQEHVQKTGMAVAVEYAGQSGVPKWIQPAALVWSYAPFSAPILDEPSAHEVVGMPLVLESKFRGHGSMEAWTINGKSWPESSVPPLLTGRRYRMRFINRSDNDHPMHLHRHTFELRTLNAPLQADKRVKDALAPLNVRGIHKDVVLVKAGYEVDVEFTANHPGNTLMHCHQQNHMDVGFMTLLKYA